MGETNRWDGFSDEELRALHAGDDPMLDAELRLELSRRESLRSTYRGPGLYVANGRRLEVLGTIGDPTAMGSRCQVVMRDEGDCGSILMAEYLNHFNEIDQSSRRVYEYLGPLQKDVSATAKVKLIDAGPDWALLETGKGQRHRLYGGDVLKVPKAIS